MWGCGFVDWPQHLMQQLINGLALGSVYALIALGYTMVYGIIKLINFAHGEIYMLGAYFGFYALSTGKFPLLPALVLAMSLAALVGLILERIAYRPLRSAPRIASLITALSASLFMQNAAQLGFGAAFKPFPQVIPFRLLNWGPVFVTNRQLIMLAIAVFLMVALHLIVHYTKMGQAMQAVSMDKDAAVLMGINVNKVISFTFAVGSALAGAGGVLVGIYYNRIDPYMGVMPGLKAFIAAVFGGIGVIPGAVVGGLLMGVAENLVVAFGTSTIRDAVAFAILILVLLLKPDGLLGKRYAEKV